MENKPIESNEIQYENQAVCDDDERGDAVFVRDGKGRLIQLEVYDDD